MAFGYQVLGFGSGAAEAGITFYGDKAVFCAGHASAARDHIDYISISTQADASDQGNCLHAMSIGGGNGVSNGPRGCVAGGEYTGVVSSDVIQYVTFASLGDATDFGDLTLRRKQGIAAGSNGTIGLFAGGNPSGVGGFGSQCDIIDYITIATTGDASDFGDLTAVKGAIGSVNSDTRFCMAGGHHD